MGITGGEELTEVGFTCGGRSEGNPDAGDGLDRGGVLGKVPGHVTKLRRDSGEAAVRRRGEAPTARGSAPAQRSRGGTGVQRWRLRDWRRSRVERRGV